jgi:hypothetical protein
MPLESLRSQQENGELDAHRTRRSARAQQVRNSLNGAETVRSATHGGAQAAPRDAVTDANDLNDTDGDERAEVIARTAPSTPEAQGQSESVGGDSDEASEETAENYDIAALDNGDEGSFARHVRRRRESRLRVIHRSSNGVHSVRQGEHDNEDSESDSENGSWDWYYEQRAAHKKNSKGDESDDDSGSGESIYISLAC